MAASVWRGRITFGLVSIPVRLVKAARRERTRFRRVQRVRADSTTESDSHPSEIPVQPPRVLEFPSAGKNIAAAPDKDESPNHPPVEETVVRVRNAPVSELTEAPVQRA